jgi:hypothetical protein
MGNGLSEEARVVFIKDSIARFGGDAGSIYQVVIAEQTKSVIKKNYLKSLNKRGYRQEHVCDGIVGKISFVILIVLMIQFSLTYMSKGGCEVLQVATACDFACVSP